MDPSTQELLALLVVALVVGRLVWRRLRRKSGGCAGCASAGSKTPTESTVHFHRRPPAP